MLVIIEGKNLSASIMAVKLDLATVYGQLTQCFCVLRTDQFGMS